MNGHGLLSLTQLNTTDPEGATEFYSELFGWRVEPTEGTETRIGASTRGTALTRG